MAQSGKKTRWAEVSCPVHGKEDSDSKVNNWKQKQVKVSIPDTKRARLSGCPKCRKGGHS